MRKITIAFLVLTASMSFAQKKELSQARSYIKSGKDYDKAEKLMTDLIAKDSASRQNKKVYATWYESVLGQYQQINEKIYLQQKYDTATVYTLLNRMYRVAESLDSLDAKPDEKGKVKLEYRKSNADQLDKLRRNLYFGGTYNVRRSKFKEAFGFFETYIDAARQPLFTAYDYAKNDSSMATAAYWATLAGYRMKDAERTLRYRKMALNIILNMRISSPVWATITISTARLTRHYVSLTRRLPSILTVRSSCWQSRSPCSSSTIMTSVSK